MPVEKSAGAVIFYRQPDGKIKYLLIKNSSNKTWGFSKGLIEEGEKLEEAALREVKEETGLDEVVIFSGFKETIRHFMKAKYDYQLKRGIKAGETILKFVTYFLAEVKNKAVFAENLIMPPEVKLSFEHDEFAWLEFEQAKELIKNKQTAEVLTKAEEFFKKTSS